MTLSYLNLHTMSLNGSFALEYLLNEDIDKFKKLSQDGIKFCSMIEKCGHLSNIIADSDIEIWEFMQTLKHFFNSDQLSEIIKEAKEIKLKLNDNPIQIKETEIRKIQNFFNYVGDPFLKTAISQSRRTNNIKKV